MVACSYFLLVEGKRMVTLIIRLSIFCLLFFTKFSYAQTGVQFQEDKTTGITRVTMNLSHSGTPIESEIVHMIPCNRGTYELRFKHQLEKLIFNFKGDKKTEEVDLSDSVIAHTMARKDLFVKTEFVCARGAIRVHFHGFTKNEEGKVEPVSIRFGMTTIGHIWKIE